ncbi:MAG TPA: SDR family NAD(P)-dependent oxidoreductase [Atribacterota bacterium]|nr:SDR family NAD(P)-dependent oxidoreductase [Atribacterota bacterium]
MKNIYIETIAPLLRGLTFDGEKGNIVIFEDDSKKVGFAIDKVRSEENLALYLKEIKNHDLLVKEQLEKKIIADTMNKFKDYIKKYKQKSKIVILENIGIFYLGESYGQAMNIKNNFEDILKNIKVKSEPSKSQDCIEKKNQKIVIDNGCNRSSEDYGSEGKLYRNNIVKNKIAVVTGGAQGFGESIVRELTKSECLVFIADINAKGANQLAEELNIKYKKTTALAIKVDVTNEDSVKKMIVEIVKKVGGMDIFISNAGVLKASSVKEMEFSEFAFVNQVNYFGYFLCVKHASKVMALQNLASKKYFTDIIQINSKSGLKGSNKNSAYAGSKFGSLGLTQSFALELIDDNIKVNAICPGNFFEGPLWADPENGLFVQYLRTGKVPGAKTLEDVKRFYESKVPMKRGCTGEDVTKAIYYLIDQKYETGQAIPVTGGQVMLK